MLTPSYAQTSNDPYVIWANLAEWVQRENMYLAAHPEEGPDKTLIEMPPARDAGDVCHVCGEIVTWVDHLPPRDPGGAARCFKNVRYPTFGEEKQIVSEHVAPDGHVLDRIEYGIDGIETPVFRALVEKRDVEIDDIFPRCPPMNAMGIPQPWMVNESLGYERDDPKHPDFHDTYADYADMERD